MPVDMHDLYALMAREVTNLVEENERMHVYLNTTIERIDANELIRHQDGKIVSIDFDHLVITLERTTIPDITE